MVRSIQYSASSLLILAIFFPFFKNILVSTSASQIFSVLSLMILSSSIALTRAIKTLKLNGFV